MSSINNNNNQKQQKVNSESCEHVDSNPFYMGIKDDFIDPLENMFGIDDFEKKMFDDFNLLPDEQKQRNPQKEQPKERKFKNGTFISQVYSSSYNNINGQPHQECYQSSSIEQLNEGHNISEVREAYKNSEGVMKSSLQRGLDKRGARFIKEKNTKTGLHNQHKILKGMKENEIEGFNKEYNTYSKKCGFKKNYKALNSFGPSVKTNQKQIADGKSIKNRN